MWFWWGPSSRLVPHFGGICSVVDRTAELMLALFRGLCGYGLGCWSGIKVLYGHAESIFLDLSILYWSSDISAVLAPPGSARPSLTTAPLPLHR